MKTLYPLLLVILFICNSFGQSYHALPGKLEAENYIAIHGVPTETCEDQGGGLDVGWMGDDSYADYNVSVPQAGIYSFNFRIANGFSDDAKLQMLTASGSVVTETVLPRTGGMQYWTTVKTTGFLSAGNQTVRILAKKGVFGLNWFSASASKPVPGRIEAENFDRITDVRTEPTGDSGGGDNVGYIDDADWMDYNVLVQQGGLYNINLRVANSYGYGIIEVQNSVGEVLGQVNVPQTGGWQNYTTISTQVTLSPGSQVLRIYARRGTFNFNWFDLLKDPADMETFVPLPGKIEAENYHEITGVETETSQDTGGGLDVGWMGDNSSVSYKVAPIAPGLYTFKLRIANGFSDDARIQIKSENGTILGESTLPRTGGMQSWSTANMVAQLPAGAQTIQLFAKKGVFALNWFEAVSSKTIPAKIEAEDFDISSDVRTEDTQDENGGKNVNYIDDQDWMDYNVSVATAGLHTFSFRVANSYGNGAIEIKDQSGNILGQVDVPRTGGWQNFTTIRTTASLTAGSQLIRILAKRGAFNFNWLEVTEGGVPVKAKAVISFASLSERAVGGAPFDLSASSTNNESPVIFTSSNPSVVSVSNATGLWKGTIVGAGSTNIIATQAATATFDEADQVSQTQVITPAPEQSLGNKVVVDPKRWYQLNNTSNGLDGLFDGNTQVNVLTGWGKVLNEYDAYYPLKDDEQLTLNAIKFFDFEGMAPDHPMTLSIINDQWQRIEIASFKGYEYGGWVGPYPDRQLSGNAKYLLDAPVGNIRYLVLNIKGIIPTEIEFYGTHTASAQQETPVPAKSVKLGDMFGVNGYEWNYEHGATPWQIDESMANAAKSFTGFRHYMDWDKLESQEGVYSFNPTISGGWHYDLIYERCKQDNIEVLACLKSQPGWLQNTYPEGQRDSEYVPVRFGKSFTDPQSYLEQARIAFQYAARYGSNASVDPALLSVHSTPRWPGDNPNTVKIGLNLVKYIECDNERDKWWKGRSGYQTGREYAANLSAFYDGHKNTMGPAIGIKNADPNMKVVIAGLVTGPDYIKGMVDWCKEFRGYNPDGSVNLCWDVVNFHLYTDNTSSSQSGSSTRGAAIETTNAGQTLDEFMKVSHEICRDMPVWITETGFDVHQSSPIKAVAIGNKSALVTQADWILRTSLFSARKGIEKVFFYQMYDDNNGGGMFGSSGLLNSDQSRRPAADYLYQVNKSFGNYHYKETINQNPIVDRYEYNGQSLYVLTVPDEVGRTADFNLNLGGNGIAKIYTPTPGADDMTLEEKPITNGSVTVTASETPIFVVQFNPSNARVASVDTTLIEKAAPQVPVENSLLLHETVTIYPNPSTDYILIDLGVSSDSDVEVKIFDAHNGQLHKKTSFTKAEAKQQVNITSLPTGMYVVEIRQGNKRAFRKVVKTL